ncbi:MAG: helix-turn-helix domain-containing protein [Kiritimatiellia bacterium]
MVNIDTDLSLIDKLRYTQAQPPADTPSFLDIHLDGQHYHYTLLIANLGEYSKSKRMPTTTHTHSVFHIVLYIAGQGFVNLEEQLHPVARGSLVIVAPNRPHSFGPAGGNVVYHAITFALCNGDDHLAFDMDHLLTHYLGKPIHLPALMQPDTAAFTLLRHRIETLAKHLQIQPIDWTQHQQQMIAILALIGNLSSNAVTAPGLIEQAQNIIENRYTDPSLTLQTLAAELHTSPEHLCRQFRYSTGSSPIQYRNHLRTQAATALLRNTNLPGKDIADRLGYTDLYTFSKAYRRATGQPPSQNRTDSN